MYIINTLDMSITVALNSIYLHFAVYKLRLEKVDAIKYRIKYIISLSGIKTKYSIGNFYMKIIKNYRAQFLPDIYDIILRMWHDANISPTYVAWSAKKYILIIEQGNDTWH